MLTDRRIVGGGAAAAVALTVLLYALAVDARLGYDASYQLVWGRDLFDGRLPGVRRQARSDATPAAGTCSRAALAARQRRR